MNLSVLDMTLLDSIYIKGDKMKDYFDIGVHICTGFSGTKIPSSLIKAIKKYKISNIILFSHNIESLRQTKNLCIELHDLIRKYTHKPAFLCIDQEGGMVSRLNSDAITTPGAMALASTGNLEYAKESAILTAKELRALRINVNLAPSADINENPLNPVIGVRSFSDDPKVVAEFSSSVALSLYENKVLPCIKHFPGHGDTYLDSHYALPFVNKTREELEDQIYPFKYCIDNNIPAIMTSHIIFKALSKDPSTISREILTSLLKEELNFKGLILTDCMQMKAISDNFGTIKASIKSLAAGSDIVFISHDARLASKAARQIYKAIKKGIINKEEFDLSTKKILDMKEKLDFYENESIDQIITAKNRERNIKIKRETLRLVSGSLPILTDKVLFIGPVSTRATLASSEYKGLTFASYLSSKVPNSKSFITDKNTTINDLKDILKDIDQIYFGSYNSHLDKKQADLIKDLIALDKQVIVIALRNPYDLKDLPCTTLAAFEYSKEMFDIILSAIKHEYILKEGVSVRL